jgi:hypothetical protein
MPDSVLEVPCLIAMGTLQGSEKFELQGQDFRHTQFQAHLMAAHTSKDFVWYSRVSWISKVLAQARGVAWALGHDISMLPGCGCCVLRGLAMGATLGR